MAAPVSIEHCSNCGAETRVGARFCYQCGGALRPDAVSVPAILTAPTALTPQNALTFPPAPFGATSPMLPPAFPPSYPSYPPYPSTTGGRMPQRSGIATAGFCLGLAAVTIGIALTWLGTIIGICGLVFSVIGIGETNPHTHHPTGPRTGRGLAITGAILSVLGIIGSVVLLIYILQNAERFGIQLPRNVGR